MILYACYIRVYAYVHRLNWNILTCMNILLRCIQMFFSRRLYTCLISPHAELMETHSVAAIVAVLCEVCFKWFFCLSCWRPPCMGNTACCQTEACGWWTKLGWKNATYGCGSVIANQWLVMVNGWQLITIIWHTNYMVVGRNQPAKKGVVIHIPTVGRLVIGHGWGVWTAGVLTTVSATFGQVSIPTYRPLVKPERRLETPVGQCGSRIIMVIILYILWIP